MEDYKFNERHVATRFDATNLGQSLGVLKSTARAKFMVFGEWELLLGNGNSFGGS